MLRSHLSQGTEERSINTLPALGTYGKKHRAGSKGALPYPFLQEPADILSLIKNPYCKSNLFLFWKSPHSAYIEPFFGSRWMETFYIYTIGYIMYLSSRQTRREKFFPQFPADGNICINQF